MRALVILGVLICLANSARALEPGDLVVVEQTRLLHVDTATGNRTVISGCVDTNACFPGAKIGSGPTWSMVGGIAFEDDGSILVGTLGVSPDPNATPRTLPPAVIRVNPTTGDRVVISGCDAVDLEAGSNPVCLSEVGSGPSIEGTPIPARVPHNPPAMSALPEWGLVLLAGVLIGLTIKRQVQ